MVELDGGGAVKTQNDRLLAAMKAGASVTPHYALHVLSIGRLAARVRDLKDAGIDIASAWVRVQNQFGEPCRVKKYWLVRSA